MFGVLYAGFIYTTIKEVFMMYGNYYPYQMQPTGHRMELIRVNGIDSARAYSMPPNSTVALFDANTDLMYIKSTDGDGFPSIRTFSFSPVEQSQQQTDYVTRREFEELKEALTNGKQSVRKHAAEPTE